jgi:pyruvate dehydrogenase E1 component beta subunit
MTGLRPIVDFEIACFIWVAWDQLISQAAKSRYVFGGQAKVPVTFRATMYYQAGIAAQHSDRPYPMLMNMPGIKIIVPSCPYDMKGLLKSAIRDDDPVFCFEDLTLAGTKGMVPDGEYVVPLGKGDVKREGDDVTVVAIAGGVRVAMEASEQLAAEGVSAEIVDPRSLVPLDTDLILGSVEKTGRLVIVDPATRSCGAAAEIAARVAESGFEALRAPIVRVTTPDIHIPFSPPLEQSVFPNPEKVCDAVRRVMSVKAGQAASL